ncbi:uncharacterized protein LOC133310342 [Gastrolobium bilobum]|uniref:uncharacterized protein LOC133310342 n=1 Tax=Gastrolobium bilobum TaxID=150636 RepID=UPI002AB08769|nr:uncharacterized protein LOC133310342 [Gastrolobium bilobum]
MDDSCAVCAETLEWTAYGPCGHREVCSTCVIRLRFICTDNHCCICKSISNIIFVTKALGDYTRMINDFSVFPTNPREGKVGSYWYHEGTQAYFDDVDHYRTIKAMCRLSCGVCDKINDKESKGTKITAEFNSIEQLESHLYHRHRLFMCSLCLEGRKIFICEQKMYNKAQLNQHLKTGDSVIDGNEYERGGFMGHPMCEFCQNPFYGENELYSHMSREHYTCHICQRLHTGQYEYYKDYDHLEIHFRQEHFLCENGACVESKFIVFATETEMKKHNAAEHTGCASLFRRNAVHQGNGNDCQGREHSYNHDSLVNQRFWAIQPSFRTVIEENISDASSSVQRFNKVKASDTESDVNSFDILAALQSESSLGCNHDLGQTSRNGMLEESSFPPLPSAARRSKHKFNNCSEERREKKMAACLRHQNKRTSSGLSSQAWHTTIYQPTSSGSSSHQSTLAADPASLSFSDFHCFSRSKSATVNGCISSGPSASSQAPLTADVKIMPVDVASSLRNFSSTSTTNHSASASNPVDTGSLRKSTKLPPISVTLNNEVQSSGQLVLKGEDVQKANKLLLEKIRATVGFDDNKLIDFRKASAGFRRGSMNSGEFLAKVHEFGLSHLTLELARLCPDAQKQKELIETYYLNARSCHDKVHLCNDSGQPKKQKNSRKGKEKCGEDGTNFNLIDNSINGLSNLQLKCKPSDREVNVLSEHDYCCDKGKSKVSVDEDEIGNSSSARPSRMEKRNKNVSQSAGAGGGSKQNLGTGAGGNKQQQKMPKFLRKRLGNDDAAVTDLDDYDPVSSNVQERSNGNKEPPRQLPVRGVWRNGGGKRLVAMTQGKLTITK